MKLVTYIPNKEKQVRNLCYLRGAANTGFRLVLRISPRTIRGFVKLKKIKKSDKNSKVGGWVKSQLGFFFLEMLCFSWLYILKKNWIREWVGVVLPIRVFLGFLDFF